MNTVLIVGGVAPRWAGHSYDISRRVLEQLRSRDVRIVLTDRESHLRAAPELVAMADETHVLDFADPPECAAWAKDRHDINAVLGFREYAVQSVAECAQILGVPGNPPDVVRRVRTKDLCREHLRRRGFRQPRTRVCTRSAHARELLDEWGKIVVKPRDKSSSEGVRAVGDPAELADAFLAAGGEEAPVLAETWVDGDEFSVEGMILGGRPVIFAVTQKHLAAGTFVEVAHTMPAQLDPGTERSVRAEVTAALQALDVRTGPFHVECWVGTNGVILGEVHVRQGGDWIHAMLEWCLPGLELYGYWLEDMLGDTPQAPVASRGAEVRFLLPRTGTVRSVRGWEDIKRAPDVLTAECSLKPGRKLTRAGSNADRHGAVVVGAQDAASASARARELMSGLAIEID